MKRIIIEQVKEFKYFGIVIADNAKCHYAIKGRIAMGKQPFTAIGELLRNGLNKNLRKRLVKMLVWSVMLNRMKILTLRKQDIKAFEAFKMLIWRTMEKSSCMEHITNEEVL